MSSWSRLLVEFPSSRLDIYRFTGLLQRSSWRTAAFLLEAASERLLQTDAVAWNAGVSAMKTASWRRSLDQLRSMEVRALEPTAVTHNILMACTTWRQSLERFRQAGELDIFSFSACMGAYLDGDLWQHALQTFWDIRDLGVQLNPVLRTLALGSDWTSALVLFGDFRRSGLVDGSFMCNALMKCFPSWQLPLHLLGDMGQMRVAAGTISYSSAISMCDKSAKWRHSLALLCRSMPNEVTYGSVISAETKGSQWKSSLCLLHDMLPRRIYLSRIGCNAAITSCEKGVAERGSYEKEATPWPFALCIMDMFADGLQANTVTHNAAISTCEKTGQWSLAGAALETMAFKSIQRDTISFNAAVSACDDDESRCWHIALAHLRSMCRLRVDGTTVTFNASISACRARWAAVVDLFASLGRQVAKDTCSLQILMGACEFHCPWAACLDLLSEEDSSPAWAFFVHRSLRSVPIGLDSLRDM
ncbi:unnamed protein product [Effrenium voratum]|uniref:Pentatricopeptide repeat-containing protein, chloroplastic n=1 Tax=Effrenium voratum TaxID=2562239 RepID=A0AA36N2E9_9DINO|nr:unnamed protein product [Effrenium voratum]CAJ1441507.1 unnamed protein product [Effrenium voratum]